MAVNKLPQSSKLVFTVQTGVDANGAAVMKQRSYGNVKTTAADADVYAVAQALGNLQKYPVNAISRIDQGSLTNV